jgi:hypothetical protein
MLEEKGEDHKKKSRHLLITKQNASTILAPIIKHLTKEQLTTSQR